MSVPEAEIIDGSVDCPVCGYRHENVEPGEVTCEHGGHRFKAVQKDAAD